MQKNENVAFSCNIHSFKSVFLYNQNKNEGRRKERKKIKEHLQIGRRHYTACFCNLNVCFIKEMFPFFPSFGLVFFSDPVYLDTGFGSSIFRYRIRIQYIQIQDFDPVYSNTGSGSSKFRYRIWIWHFSVKEPGSGVFR